MIIKRGYYLPTLLGIAVLGLGASITIAQWAFGNESIETLAASISVRTAIGVSLLLSILAASLLAAFLSLPDTNQIAERRSLALGAITGAAAGLAVQISWFIADNHRIPWLIPLAHRLSLDGYCYVVYFCMVSSCLFSLASGVGFRTKRVVGAGPTDLPRTLALSPLLLLILTCLWTFDALIIEAGEAGARSAVAVSLTITPSFLSTGLCLYVLRTHWADVLQTMGWALVLAVLFFLLITRWPASLDVPIGLIVALGLTSAIIFRDAGWSHRIAESWIIGTAVICLIVLPLGDPTKLVRNLLLSLSFIPVVVGLTAAGPLVRRSFVKRCPMRDAWRMCVFTASVPVSAWLLTGGLSDTGAGSFAILLAAPIVGERLVPWYQAEMEELSESEESAPGVTANPRLTALARLTALRGASWGIAAIAALLGLVISAGPSMGFSFGSGMPNMNPWLTLSSLLAAVGSVTIAVSAKRSRLAPVSAILGGIIVFSFTAANYLQAQRHQWWWIWVIVAAVLIATWEIESIVANSAMRPRWLVRREWRNAVAIPLALAVGSLTFLACTDGMINAAGRPADPLASLLMLGVEALTGLLLVMSAGWSLDWQSKSIADKHLPVSGESFAPNWAGYRLRGCIMMDFGLIQGLMAIGIWLPALTVAHIGLSSHNSIFNSAVMAFTGMWLFVPIFIWTLRNSVRYVNQQSIKASRPPRSWFYGTLPHVSPDEEKEVIRSLFIDHDGPTGQRDWSRSLATHQLHLNLISLAVTTVSLGGGLGILLYIKGPIAPRSRSPK